MFTWDRLRVFAAIAEYGSITSAAEALHITGSAVSQHLRKLEREARCPLVEPDGRGIRLTAAGRVLAASAREMAATAATAERDLATIDELVAGPLRIGSVASAVRTLLPDVLHALATAHPRLHTWLSDGEVVELLPALRAGRLDAVIMESWTSRPTELPPGLRITHLLTEDIMLAVSERNPLATRESVPISALHEQTWSTCGRGTEAHDAVAQTLRQHGIDAESRYQVVDYGTQLALVAANLAVAMVPRIGRPRSAPGVVFVRCEPTLTRTLAVATTGAADTPVVRAFRTELERVASALAEGPAIGTR
ncbi:LysR family transcriptional regulator [Pseudonocardia spinosispora]|uniref:LysR family transcriptional regulator n=1 Tax=Pseudonocardia spinosispora TaxID=103441 RepID=UPI000415F3F7|nr:LysR family transcriptional regulator [Pseudonocardia spinosispora]